MWKKYEKIWKNTAIKISRSFHTKCHIQFATKLGRIKIEMWRKKEEKYAKTQPPKYLAALPFTHKMSSLICKNTWKLGSMKITSLQASKMR